MPKKNNETFLEYRKRVMDDISQTYCAAKWFNASIWLAGGKTTSCHHPLAHDIDLEEIIRSKMDFDVSGHYTRNDIFRFMVEDQPEIKQVDFEI